MKLSIQILALLVALRVGALETRSVGASDLGNVMNMEGDERAPETLKPPEVSRSDAAEAPDARRSTTSTPGHETPSLTIGEVLRVLIANNPSLKAARANWEAMKQRVPQPRAWEDLRSEFDTVAGRLVSIPPNAFTDQKLVVEQPVPLSGKNRLRGNAAEADAAAAYGDFRRRELDLIARGKTLYYRLANAYQQLEINLNNTEFLERFGE